MNPKLAPYLEEQDYVMKIKMLQTNPQALNMCVPDLLDRPPSHVSLHSHLSPL